MMFLQVGTFCSSDHHAGVSTQQAHHPTHSWCLLKDSFGVKDQSGSSSPLLGDSVPDRNSCTSESNSGGCSKSSGSSAQDRGQEPAASGLCLPAVVGEGACFTSVSPLWLESSKVTLFLSLTGLGKAAHLLAGSPVQSASEEVCLL